MSEEIINRVANSKLITLDLEEFYPEGTRVPFDISPWLYEGIVLKEKDFRAAVQGHNWAQYGGQYVGLYCATDAIIPAWAFMLVSLQLTPYAKKVVVGGLNTLETVLYTEIIAGMDMTQYENQPIIIKGCTHKPIPQNAYVLLAQKLQPHAKSILYGEACSSVPLLKKNRT